MRHWHYPTPLNGRLLDHLDHLAERETMLSGTAEPECRDHPSEVVAAVGASVSGTDTPTRAFATTRTSADGAPLTEATKITARATIHPSVNGMATAGCIAGSTAVI
jgi:hypothetical protein